MWWSFTDTTVNEALVIVNIFIRVVQKVKTQIKCAETVCISVRIAPFQSCELRKHANTKWCLKSGLQYSNIHSKCAATDCSTYVKFDKPSFFRTEKRLLKDALYSLHRLLGDERHDRHKLPWSMWRQVQNFRGVTKGNRSVLQREQPSWVPRI